MFWNQAVHSFQKKLLRTKIKQAKADEKIVKCKLERAKSAVQRGVYEKFLSFVIKILPLRGQRQTTTVKETHQKTLLKLSERHLGMQREGSVKTLDDVESPDWYKNFWHWGQKILSGINLRRHTFSLILTSFFWISKVVKPLGRPFVRSKQWQKPTLKR